MWFFDHTYFPSKSSAFESSSFSSPYCSNISHLDVVTAAISKTNKLAQGFSNIIHVYYLNYKTLKQHKKKKKKKGTLILANKIVTSVCYVKILYL